MFEQFGDGLETAIVLSVVSEGMPLIYNGQEAGNPRRLAFFEKDPIQWQEHPIGDLYKKLIALKKKNSTLWNADWGARMIQVPNNAPSKVLSFVRQNKVNKVFAVLNFSDQHQKVSFKESLYHGSYSDYFQGKKVELKANTILELKPWEYRIFAQ
jgi:hypothetical protein